MKKYQKIARDVTRYIHVHEFPLDRPNRAELTAMARDKLSEIEKDLPSGSGIDHGCKVDLDASNENRLVIAFGFHHMDKDGFYRVWTDHRLTLKPSLQFGFDMRITGRDLNEIKDYLYQTFECYFNAEVE